MMFIMRKTCSALCALFLFPSWGGLAAEKLADKEAFNGQYPKRFVFRGEYQRKPNANYEAFLKATAFSGGVIQKFVPIDEMPRLDAKTRSGFADRYARENPGKLVLLHWDAQEHVNTIPESSGRYFPGHWCLYEGTILREALGTDDEWIKVEDYRVLARETKNRKARSKWWTPTLLLLALDDQGKALWDHYEYVELLELDKENQAIRVKRGQALSSARSFAKGSRIAGIATYLSTPHLLAFNYSTKSPVDKNGKCAADIQFEELIELFDSEKGLLRNANGIAFDVLNWIPPHNRELIDSDGDGKADGAYDPVTGEDLWRKGAYAFQKRLREHFGRDFILMNDGAYLKDQRAVGVFDGIESEGLVRHNDAFRGFSKTLNVFDYWEKNNPTAYRMATIVPKLKNPADAKHPEKYTRFCMAVATCLGAAINTGPVSAPDEVPEEIRGGDMNTPYWLGKALAPMKNWGLEGPDLLAGLGKSRDFMAAWEPYDCDIKYEGGSLLVSGRDKTAFRKNSVVKWLRFKVPEEVNDITVVFEAKAREGLLGMDKGIPRILSFSVEGLPSYEGNPRQDRMYNDMWGLFGSSAYTELSFYYREVAGRTLNFVISIEGAGEVEIRNFRVNAAVSALSREFEKGVVLANPSLREYTFNLREMFGSSAFKRLKGEKFPNDGTEVGTHVKLGPMEGLFLRKIPPEHP